MAGFVRHILRLLAIAIIAPGLAFGAQAQNPRSAVSNNTKTTTRGVKSSDANAAVRRSATAVIARSTNTNNRKSRMVVTARPVATRSATNLTSRSGAKIIKNSPNVSRAATSKTGLVRSAAKQKNVKNIGKAGLSRAGKSRLTAVFDDVSKIGGGYSNCRDAYATCMDQFCATADVAYRRCYCSDRFMDFRDMNDNIMTATGLMEDFGYNNLTAVDKTADEVNAMYSATAGENAIKKDTSGAQQILNEITDLLSGKKSKRSSPTLSNTTSLGVLNFDGFSDIGDIWSGEYSSMSSVFDIRGADRLASLEGSALYQEAAKQCASITRDSCSGDAMFNLASSAYSVLVTQDCNYYEKVVNGNKEKLMQSVRDLESDLRMARLENYRAHNSKDVNECLSKVEAAMTDDGPCGSNYAKCLDYTGRFIGANGEALYTSELFKMLETIAPELPDDGDIITANPKWDNQLESMKNHVNVALDTCQGIAEDVWNEFKRTAIIRIAQAQVNALEDVKNSCVNTIKNCYNGTDETLKDIPDSMDLDEKYDTGATRALAARGMCYDKVLACAALYGGADGCAYNKVTRRIEKNPDNTNKCGLQSLLAYVDSVDTSRVAQSCENAVTAYARDLCTPDSSSSYSYYYGDYDSTGYPAKCANMPKSQLRASLLQHANDYCAKNEMANDTANVNGSPLNTDVVDRVLRDIFSRLGLAWTKECEETKGVWLDDVSDLGTELTEEFINKDFYNTYYGGSSLAVIKSSIQADDAGVCLAANEKLLCEQWITESARDASSSANDLATYNSTSGKCSLTDKWYEQQCKELGGSISGGQCVVGKTKSSGGAFLGGTPLDCSKSGNKKMTFCLALDSKLGAIKNWMDSHTMPDAVWSAISDALVKETGKPLVSFTSGGLNKYINQFDTLTQANALNQVGSIISAKVSLGKSQMTSIISMPLTEANSPAFVAGGR